MLLPDPDGKVGSVSVSNEEGTQILTQAGQAAEVVSLKKPPAEPFQMEEQKIKEVFGTALEAAPQLPAKYILYFKIDSTDLVDESLALLPEIIAEIEKRGSTDTSVVGHTDTAGAKEYNYKLSLGRAKIVAEQLISQGVNAGILQIDSHGEEILLIKTEDDVHEPRNRRVEVTVR